LVNSALPTGWKIGIFGSASRCGGSGASASVESDIDLVIVRTSGAELSSAAIRRHLAQELVSIGLRPDIVVLSDEEQQSTDFWSAEGVVELGMFVARCPARSAL
jgi:predicted nucleotidyltransferase